MIYCQQCSPGSPLQIVSLRTHSEANPEANRSYMKKICNSEQPLAVNPFLQIVFYPEDNSEAQIFGATAYQTEDNSGATSGAISGAI